MFIITVKLCNVSSKCFQMRQRLLKWNKYVVLGLAIDLVERTPGIMLSAAKAAALAIKDPVACVKYFDLFVRSVILHLLGLSAISSFKKTSLMNILYIISNSMYSFF
jgi:hypothetical protein